jgi:PleD family two-component response regulator
MKALVVEDDTVTRLILARILTDRGYEVTACASAEEAIEAYRLAFYPLLFLDLLLPGMDGFSFCRWVRRQPEGKRHLVLVGTASDRKGDLQKILDAGADDYITKPYHADTLDIRLMIARARVKNIELRTTLESNLNQERERLHYLATHDPLTKLLNRTALIDVIQDAVKAGRAGNQSALIYLDLDNFKLVNDSRGHGTGDEVALLLRNIVLDETSLARTAPCRIWATSDRSWSIRKRLFCKATESVKAHLSEAGKTPPAVRCIDDLRRINGVNCRNSTKRRRFVLLELQVRVLRSYRSSTTNSPKLWRRS